ncbi:hypothetical protein CEUSTIGMA_g5845.t1 [Chlamydomonas eustigma]|uniref:Uncharacterized protein n=1 Tax=Chlamydomonas eustigma TaxID=1157962 RepID=A0A250X5P8_9CHLO|nr:hypothetical protein CEUSTIGMA_g5845.t1 [Chlamydomonas eustigma]|eukprot:GAX78403.1 hypothetical protein CEUSTIGMA_g5845.t1 [Chlamydomonas eustigma]
MFSDCSNLCLKLGLEYGQQLVQNKELANLIAGPCLRAELGTDVSLFSEALLSSLSLLEDADADLAAAARSALLAPGACLFLCQSLPNKREERSTTLLCCAVRLFLRRSPQQFLSSLIADHSVLAALNALPANLRQLLACQLLTGPGRRAMTELESEFIVDVPLALAHIIISRHANQVIHVSDSELGVSGGVEGAHAVVSHHRVEQDEEEESEGRSLWDDHHGGRVNCSWRSVSMLSFACRMLLPRCRLEELLQIAFEDLEEAEEAISASCNSVEAKCGASNSASCNSAEAKCGASNSASCNSAEAKCGASNSASCNSAEAKCGASNSASCNSVEAKCGASNSASCDSAEAKCGASNSASCDSAEAKCGASNSASCNSVEAKCGASNSASCDSAEAKCGASNSASCNSVEAKCGASNSASCDSAEAKCGASKCETWRTHCTPPPRLMTTGLAAAGNLPQAASKCHAGASNPGSVPLKYTTYNDIGRCEEACHGIHSTHPNVSLQPTAQNVYHQTPSARHPSTATGSWVSDVVSATAEMMFYLHGLNLQLAQFRVRCGQGIHNGSGSTSSCENSGVLLKLKGSSCTSDILSSVSIAPCSCPADPADNSAPPIITDVEAAGVLDATTAQRSFATVDHLGEASALPTPFPEYDLPPSQTRNGMPSLVRSSVASAQDARATTVSSGDSHRGLADNLKKLRSAQLSSAEWVKSWRAQQVLDAKQQVSGREMADEQVVSVSESLRGRSCSPVPLAVASREEGVIVAKHGHSRMYRRSFSSPAVLSTSRKGCGFHWPFAPPLSLSPNFPKCEHSSSPQPPKAALRDFNVCHACVHDLKLDSPKSLNSSSNLSVLMPSSMTTAGRSNHIAIMTSFTETSSTSLLLMGRQAGSFGIQLVSEFPPFCNAVDEAKEAGHNNILGSLHPVHTSPLRGPGADLQLWGMRVRGCNAQSWE